MTIYSLDMLFPNFEPICCAMFGSNCCFLTCILVSQEAGKVVWYSHIFKNFPQFVVSFPGGAEVKVSACNVGDLGLIPGLGRSPGEGKGYPLQYSGLENSMDCIVHGIAESDMIERFSLYSSQDLLLDLRFGAQYH